MPTHDILARFQASVSKNGYEWVNTRDGPALMERSTRSSQQSSYYPFSDGYSALFMEFSNLELNQSAILAFANKYGLLGEPVTRHFDDKGLSLFQLLKVGELYDSELLSDASSKQAKEYGVHDLFGWADHIIAMGGLLKSVAKHKRGETLWKGPTLSLEMTRYSPRVVSTATGLPASASGTPKRWMRLMEGPFLADRASKMLSTVVKPRVVWVPGRGAVRPTFRLEIEPRSLIGCLWLQAVMYLAERKTFRRCRVAQCGKLIEISTDRSGRRTDTKFCSDLCRMREHRRRKSRISRQGQKA